MVSAVLLVVVPSRLGADDFGTYQFVFAFVGFFTLIGSLGTNTYLVKEVARDHSVLGRLVVDRPDLAHHVAFGHSNTADLLAVVPLAAAIATAGNMDLSEAPGAGAVVADVDEAQEAGHGFQTGRAAGSTAPLLHVNHAHTAKNRSEKTPSVWITRTWLP